MTDVLIAGGGVVGRVTALRLAQAGARVTLVEPGGVSATSAAGAMLGVHSEVSSTDDESRLGIDLGERCRARVLWDALADALGTVITPGLFVIANMLGQDDGRELGAIAAAAGPELAKPVAPADVPGLAPRRDARPFDALWLPGDATVDADAVLRALDSALAATATVTLHPASVAAIALDPAGVRATLSDGTVAAADRVVLACGVGITPLLTASGLSELGVAPVLGGRGVSVVVSGGPGLPHAIRTPNRAFACGLHALPRGATTYLGATNRLSTRPERDARPTLGEISTVVDGAVAEITGRFRDATFTSASAGHRPFVADHLPVVGATRDPRVILATGTYRNGWLLAPRVAELVVDEVATPGSTGEHAFSPLRDVVPGAPLISDLIGAAAADALLDDGAETVERFVVTAVRALLGGADRDRLVRKLERLLATAPVDEVAPLLVEAVARHR